MTDKQSSIAHGQWSGTSLFIGVAAILLVFVVSGFVSYRNTRTLSQDARHVTHTHEILWALSDLLSLIKDAETGQRGYLITGDDRYLEPYTKAVSCVDQQVIDIERSIGDKPDQLSRMPAIKEQIHTKLKELDETVVLRRTQGFDAARAVVVSDRGKAAMDAIRHLFETMQEEERLHRTQRLAEMENAYEVAVGSGFLTGGLGIMLIIGVAYLVRRAMLTRQRQEWLQSGQIGLSQAPPETRASSRWAKGFSGSWLSMSKPKPGLSSPRTVVAFVVSPLTACPLTTELPRGLRRATASWGRR